MSALPMRTDLAVPRACSDAETDRAHYRLSVTSQALAVQQCRAEALKLIYKLRRQPDADFEGDQLLAAVTRLTQLEEVFWAERGFAAVLEQYLGRPR